MTENELRSLVIAQAKGWLGRKEADGSHREIIDVYHSIRPLPRAYRMSYTDPWCAAFVSAVGQACGLTDLLLPECGCDRMIELYRDRGRFRSAEYADARPGDLIFYDWDRNGSADHVGLIAEVTTAGFRVIEGNMNDAVGCRTVRRDYDLIRGFALPDYASRAGEPEEPAAPGAEIPVSDPPKAAVTLPVLSEGDAGETVRAAQLLLIGRGYYCGGKVRRGHEQADGEFGPTTKTAVEGFQLQEKLEATGSIGIETWTKLLGVM